MGTLFHSRQTTAALVWDGLAPVLGEFILQSRNCRPFALTSFDLFEVAGGAFLPQRLNYAAPLWFGFHVSLLLVVKVLAALVSVHIAGESAARTAGLLTASHFVVVRLHVRFHVAVRHVTLGVTFRVVLLLHLTDIHVTYSLPVVFRPFLCRKTLLFDDFHTICKNNGPPF